MTDSIRDDIQSEALRIVEAATAQGLTLRLLGGLAIRLHSPSANHRTLARHYPDIDFATSARRSTPVEALFTGLGYEPNKTFNLLNGDSRLLFYDTARNRQIDVFIGGFEMCHRVPVTDRIAVERLTLPLAELLLTKLQIVQMNEKDVRDICALLLDHPLGPSDDETIRLDRIVELTVDDWGLWKTVTVSAQKVQDSFDGFDLAPSEKATIVERLDVLRKALDESPKTLRWKTRALLGEKVQWYDLPEEVRRG